MSWLINGIKEWSTDYTTTFNTSQSTTTTFSTSNSTTTTFSTSRSTTTTFNTSKTTSTTTTVTTYGNTNNGSILVDTGRWIVYQSYNVSHMNYVQGHWYNQADGANVNSGRQDFSDYNSSNTNPITADGWTYYKGNVWNNEVGSCCGGVNWVYNNILYRTSSANTSFTTTYGTSATTTTTFNTSQSTTTTFNTSRSTTTTFNTSRSTTTTFSTSRTTDRTTNFYA